MHIFLLLAACSDQQITANRFTPPTDTATVLSCEVESPTPDSTVRYQTPVEFVATVEHVGSEVLSASMSSDQDGQFASELEIDDGRVVHATDALSASTHVITVTVRAGDVTATCGTTGLLVCGGPSVALESLDVTRFQEGDLIALRAQVDDLEDAPEELALVWASDRDGVLSTDGADATGLAELYVSDLSTAEGGCTPHVLTLDVTDGCALTSTASVALDVCPAEACDGVDNDGDGEVDEGTLVTWCRDVDGDGWGDDDFTAEGCAVPEGYVAEPGDCDDTDAATHPAATEVCGGADEDCDGLVDDDDATVTETSGWFADFDLDGWGDAGAPATACDPPSGYVADDTDCDDAAADVNPDAAELCDDEDDDCDGVVDEDDAGDADTWYADTDGDAFGDPASTLVACDAPSGYVADDSDCDDADSDVSPAAHETCNDVDDDCDGDVDEDDANDAETWYADADGDGWGDAVRPPAACDVPSGYVPDGTDGDDDDATVNPAAAESLDGLDDDCEGTTDLLPSDEASATWSGATTGDTFGVYVVGLGEANGDGYDDVAFGAAGADSAYVVFGSVTPSGGTADLVVTGDSGSELGTAIVGADHDHSGVADLFVGAPGSGEVYLFEGPLSTATLTPADADATLAGNSGFGSWLAGGLLDEGYERDVVIGDYRHSDYRGQVGVFLGPVSDGDSAAFTIAGEAILDGVNSAALIRMNGNSFDTLAIAASGYDGAGVNTGGIALVYLDGGVLSGDYDLGDPEIDAVLTGAADGDYLSRVASAGDVNGDGYDELLASSQHAGAAGEVYLYYGGTSLPASGTVAAADATFVGYENAVGETIAGAGDVDDDGLAEVLMGDKYADLNGAESGAAWLVLGSSAPLGSIDLESAADAIFYGAEADDNFGYSVAGAGDVNGDGRDDVLVGGTEGTDAGGIGFGSLFLSTFP